MKLAIKIIPSFPKQKPMQIYIAVPEQIQMQLETGGRNLHEVGPESQIIR